MGRPLRGSNRDEFYTALDSVSSKAIDGQLPSSIDSAFQLQEYISALVRDDPHNVERIVRIPRRDDKEKEKEKDRERDESEVDEDCWIYEQLRRLALDLTYPLVDKLQECCSRQSCPEMKAGEWLYLCVAHGSGSAGVMEQCCAIDYILHTIDSATALLNSPKAFPSRISIPYQSRRHFPSLARRLGRIFAHAYFHHREEFTEAEEQNSLYARFLALAKRFDLVPSEFLVIPISQDGSKHNEINENTNANVGKNGSDQLQGQSSSFSSQEPVDTTVPSKQSPGSNANSSPVNAGGNSNSNSPTGIISRSPRNRLRTDTMYLSGTFHERSSGISSGAAGNGLENSPTRRVSSPLAATLASQEEEDERAESIQSQSRAEGSIVGETSKDPESAHHPDQTTDTTALSTIPVIVSNAPVKVLVRDFAIETATVSASGPASESPVATTIGLEGSSSTSETEITIPVPLSRTFIPPIVVNAPEVVITNPDGLDSPSQHDHDHSTFVTEVSAEDDEEENADVDDLEHALENNDSEEDADDGDDEEEEEEEAEHEAAIGANVELPESDIASAAAIEVRFEQIAPERERKEGEEGEEHEAEHAQEPESSSAISVLDETSTEPPAEPPTESDSNAFQDPDTTLHDISIDNSVAEVDAYLIGSQSEDEEDDNSEQIPAISGAFAGGAKDARSVEDPESVETQHSEALPAAASEDIDDGVQSESQASNDTSALEQVAAKPSVASPSDSAIEQKSITDAGETPEVKPESKAAATISTDLSISETNAGEEEK